MRLNLGVGRRIVALLGSPRATRQLHQVSRHRIVALLWSLRATRQPTNRSCGFWSGDGGAHREAPGELAITGSHGEKSSKSGLHG